MPADEMEQLRKELDRQTRIIDALLDNNTQLKQALALCRHMLTYPENEISSNDTEAKPVKQEKEKVEEKKDGGKFLPDNIIPVINGVIRTFNDIREQIIGGNFLLDGSTKQNDGGNFPLGASPAIKDGGKYPATMVAQDGNDVKPTDHAVDKANLVAAGETDITRSPVTGNNHQKNTYHVNGKEVVLFTITQVDMAEGKHPVSFQKLYALLRKMIVRASEGGLTNTAQILMKLYESPVQPLQNLRQLTHLSEDGMTKRIMAMKKLGLIIRAPGRQLLLTPKARHLLDEAR